MTLDPKIYRRAAVMIVESKYSNGCCLSIDMSSNGFTAHSEKMEFYRYFRPEKFSYDIYFMGPRNKRRRLPRSLALLFMEQIAKDLMKEKRGQL